MFQCDFDDCLAKKFGFYGEDGKLDKEALTSNIEKKYENNKEVVIAMKENCINGDISKYGPPDMCDMRKMKHCFDNQLIKVNKQLTFKACNNFLKSYNHYNISYIFRVI